MRAFDPGTGPDRYEKALVSLRESGMPVGFASFTFDADLEGSVLLVPEAVNEVDTESLTPSTASLPDGAIVADGSEQWIEGMRRAIGQLEAGHLEKVVLSRQVTAAFDEEIPALEVVRRLHLDQPTCYTFAVAGLVGASPELLVSFERGRVRSLALAGTAVDAEDLRSSKIEREHHYTASSVESALNDHVTDLEVMGRGVVSFGEIKHLASRFEGRALPGTSVLTILASLHPTAAVAGSPLEPALDLIRDLEPMGRGRYAGPVGWFNTDGEGEFAIALRCGLIEGESVTMYAGGGIIVGSDPESEFEETELKLRPMLRALGIG